MLARYSEVVEMEWEEAPSFLLEAQMVALVWLRLPGDQRPSNRIRSGVAPIQGGVHRQSRIVSTTQMETLKISSRFPREAATGRSLLTITNSSTSTNHRIIESWNHGIMKLWNGIIELGAVLGQESTVRLEKWPRSHFSFSWKFHWEFARHKWQWSGGGRSWLNCCGHCDDVAKIRHHQHCHYDYDRNDDDGD